MEKIKKGYKTKIVIIPLVLIFLFQTTGYSYLRAPNNKTTLRPPMIFSKEGNAAKQTVVAVTEDIKLPLEKLAIGILEKPDVKQKIISEIRRKVLFREGATVAVLFVDIFGKPLTQYPYIALRYNSDGKPFIYIIPDQDERGWKNVLKLKPPVYQNLVFSLAQKYSTSYFGLPVAINDQLKDYDLTRDVFVEFGKSDNPEVDFKDLVAHFAEDFLEDVLKKEFGFMGTLKSFQKESLFHSSYGLLFLEHYANMKGVRITISFLELLEFLGFRVYGDRTIEKALDALERGGNIDSAGTFSSSQTVVLQAGHNREFRSTGLVHEVADNSVINFHIHPAILGEDWEELLNFGDMYAFATHYSTLQEHRRQITSCEAIFDEKLRGKLFIPREGIDWLSVKRDYLYRGARFSKQHIPEEEAHRYFIIYDIDYSDDSLAVAKRKMREEIESSVIMTPESPVGAPANYNPVAEKNTYKRIAESIKTYEEQEGVIDPNLDAAHKDGRVEPLHKSHLSVIEAAHDFLKDNGFSEDEIALFTSLQERAIIEVPGWDKGGLWLVIPNKDEALPDEHASDRGGVHIMAYPDADLARSYVHGMAAYVGLSHEQAGDLEKAFIEWRKGKNAISGELKRAFSDAIEKRKHDPLLLTRLSEKERENMYARDYTKYKGYVSIERLKRDDPGLKYTIETYAKMPKVQNYASRSTPAPPIKVWYDISRDKYTVEDGYHRIAAAVLRGEDSMDAIITEVSGSPSSVFNALSIGKLSDGKPHTRKEIANALERSEQTVQPDLYFLIKADLLIKKGKGSVVTYEINQTLSKDLALIRRIQEILDGEFQYGKIVKNLRDKKERERIIANIKQQLEVLSTREGDVISKNDAVKLTLKQRLAKAVTEIWHEFPDTDKNDGLRIVTLLRERNPALYREGELYFEGATWVAQFASLLAKSPENVLSYTNPELLMELLGRLKKGDERWIIAIDGQPGNGKTTLWYAIQRKDTALGELHEDMEFIEGEKQLWDWHNDVMRDQELPFDIAYGIEKDPAKLEHWISRMAEKHRRPMGLHGDIRKQIGMMFINGQNVDGFVRDILRDMEDRIIVYNANGSHRFVDGVLTKSHEFPFCNIAKVTVITNADKTRSLSIQYSTVGVPYQPSDTEDRKMSLDLPNLAGGFQSSLDGKQVHVRGISVDPRIIRNYIAALQSYTQNDKRVVPQVYRVYVPRTRLDINATVAAKEIILVDKDENKLPYATVSLLRDAQKQRLFEMVELWTTADYQQMARDLGINEDGLLNILTQSNLVIFISDWVGPNVDSFLMQHIENEEILRNVGIRLGETLLALHSNNLIANDTHLGQFVVKGSAEEILRIDLVNIYSLDEASAESIAIEYEEVYSRLSSYPSALEGFLQAYPQEIASRLFSKSAIDGNKRAIRQGI